jgi:uncharacterized protein HemY
VEDGAAKHAKELAPDNTGILLALGNAYVAEEHYSSAIKEYRELLETQPDLEIARAHLAKALRADGRTEEAKRNRNLRSRINFRWTSL